MLLGIGGRSQEKSSVLVRSFRWQNVSQQDLTRYFHIIGSRIVFYKTPQEEKETI